MREDKEYITLTGDNLSNLRQLLQRNATAPQIPSMTRTLIILTKPGLQKLMLRSDKPECITFSDWIVYEVLPQIETTGTYTALPKVVSDHPMMIQARKDMELTRKYVELDLEQYKQSIKVDVRVIRRAIQNKKLPAYKMARENRISKKDLDEWVKDTCTIKEKTT